MHKATSIIKPSENSTCCLFWLRWDTQTQALRSAWQRFHVSMFSSILRWSTLCYSLYTISHFQHITFMLCACCFISLHLISGLCPQELCTEMQRPKERWGIQPCARQAPRSNHQGNSSCLHPSGEQQPWNEGTQHNLSDSEVFISAHYPPGSASCLYYEK